MTALTPEDQRDAHHSSKFSNQNSFVSVMTLTSEKPASESVFASASALSRQVIFKSSMAPISIARSFVQADSVDEFLQNVETASRPPRLSTRLNSERPLAKSGKK